MHLRDELTQRGFLYQYTDEKVFDIFEKGGHSFYLGVDPSADSMTIGNFVALMHAIHYMLKGNKCYLLVWWATGMIGNPTGKDQERNFLDEATLQKNQQGIYNDFVRVCANVEKTANKKLNFEIVNNYDWFKNINYLDFLKDVGKSMTVNRMMNKDIVKKRINDPDKSISYAEFSYMLIMGYDFYVLNKEHNVILEVGGSDERDGILAGVEITHKLGQKEVYGATNNLITDSTGKKFGKSEGNALWLNPEKNSPFVIYQYFMNTTDDDIERYLKLFTLLDFNEIDKIVAIHQKDLSARRGQEELAKLVITTIFGEDAAHQAALITQTLFGNEDKIAAIQQMKKSDIDALAAATGCIEVNSEQKILDLCTQSGITESNGEAKKQIQAGAIYVNEIKIDDVQQIFAKKDAINGILLLRKGKKTFKVIKYT